ncbi:hypothetical protein ACHAPE_007186 [Trichoderma viride]
MNLYSKTTIILDALDESDIATYNLAKIVIDMMDEAIKPVKIFISSRPDREYLEAFEAKATIMVNSSNQQGDIEKYLDEALYATKFFQRRQVEIQALIKRTFRSQNGGMFRWVYLQAKSLQKCVSDNAIRTWAKTIPRDLMAAYDRLWEDLESQHNESDMALARRAIQWVLCSVSPLISEVILEAIRYGDTEDEFGPIEPQTEQEILSLCQDFLTIDVERKVWMLPHASVAEYFDSRKSKGMGLGDCDLLASKVLLRFLMAPEWTPRDGIYVTDDDTPKSFKSYAISTWHQHVGRYDEWLDSKGIAPEQELTMTLKRFLGSPRNSSDSYRKWVSCARGTRLATMVRPAEISIFVVCVCGFYHTLRDWWESDQIDQELALTRCEETTHIISEDLFLSVLDLAALGGCVPMCRHLVSVVGISDLHQGRFFEMARIAMAEGQKRIIKLLVEEANVDLNITYMNADRTLAQLAVSCNPTFDMIQWIIDQGWVDVNRQAGRRFGSLLIAAARQSPTLVGLLLRAGADANAPAKCGAYGSALIAAAMQYSGYSLLSVEILLRAGADANAAAECGIYGNALIAATSTQNRPVNDIYTAKIKALLDNGADANQIPQVGLYGSALEALMCDTSINMFSELASSRNRVLELLLESGADPAMALHIGEHGQWEKAGGRMPLSAQILDKKISVHNITYDIEIWKEYVADIAAYLADEVGVDRETLRKIGILDMTVKRGEFPGYTVGYNPDIS